MAANTRWMQNINSLRRTHHICQNRIIAIIQLRRISETQCHQKGFGPTWIGNNALSSGARLIARIATPQLL